MEVGVLEVNIGSQGGKRQGRDDTPEHLHTKFLWADEAVEGRGSSGITKKVDMNLLTQDLAGTRQMARF